mmetsp:Transcript_47534/g.93775  ORF Transcript_47534/g.93775 Transcript_47534/m.93775 type:complete len:95 (-) Transcript_47534:1012-1296(-)
MPVIMQKSTLLSGKPRILPKASKATKLDSLQLGQHQCLELSFPQATSSCTQTSTRTYRDYCCMLAPKRCPFLSLHCIDGWMTEKRGGGEKAAAA